MRIFSLSFLMALACSTSNKGPHSLEGVDETAATDSSAQTDTADKPQEDSGHADTIDTGIASIPVEVVDVSVNVPPDCTVCAVVHLTLDRPAPVTVLLGKEGESLAPWVRSTEVTDIHTMTLLEMQPDTPYRIHVSIPDQEMDPSHEYRFRTGMLPEGIPEVTLRTGGDIRQQPGLTLMTVVEWANPDGRRFFVLAVDEEGQIVWYHQLDRLTLALAVDAQRRIYTTDSLLQAVRIDPYGQTKTIWTAEDLGISAIHHDFRPTPDGRLALISTDMEPIAGWPIEGSADTRSYNVVADRFMIFDEDGTEVWSWDMFDHFEPTAYYTHDLHMGFWEMPPYLDVDKPKDWSHANALVPNGDNWLVSLRNLDRIIEINPATHSVEWIFGPRGDFELAEGSRWFSRQHSPIITDDGNILMYDNGLDRFDASEHPEERPFTRVVEYALDHEAMTAAEVWSWDGGERYLCPITGTVQQLENGNHFISDGALIEDLAAITTSSPPHYSARLREIVGTTDPEVIWELVVGTPEDTEAPSWYVYRAERIDSLYPPFARAE